MRNRIIGGWERSDKQLGTGAEEGTRTPTPLRVHGPEPCASANSATSASDCLRGGKGRLDGRDCDIYSTSGARSVKPATAQARLRIHGGGMARKAGAEAAKTKKGTAQNASARSAAKIDKT